MDLGAAPQTEGARHAVVIGGSLSGLFAAAALARNEWQVTVMDRDQLPAGPEHRRGLPQDRQTHILLHRGLLAIETLLPGFRAGLLSRGAVAFDTGLMPWLGQHGWLDNSQPGWEIVSATRPLMDAVARVLLIRLPGVEVSSQTKVIGLRLPDRDAGWRVRTEMVADAASAESGRRETREIAAAVVVDASGRGSRLAHWLPGLASAPVESIDARVGYAGRLYAQRGSLPLRTGVMIFGTVSDGLSGLALPVEGRRWMISTTGIADHRPPRDAAGFVRFLAGLRDPAVADLVSALEPVSAVAVHRQTSNRRYPWGRQPGWPDGLLVVGDALCCLDPIYGQGISVAALQAELLAGELGSGRPVDGRLQRRLHGITEAPWSIATSNDRQFPSSDVQPSRAQRLNAAFIARLGRLAAAGHARASRTLSDVYQLMAPPTALFHPALVLAAARPLPTRHVPRPAVLEELSRARRERPPAAPASV